jgi:hypothetical protein
MAVTQAPTPNTTRWNTSPTYNNWHLPNIYPWLLHKLPPLTQPDGIHLQPETTQEILQNMALIF